jgi:glycosyltransferase involved in cell wall biosynthesis
MNFIYISFLAGIPPRMELQCNSLRKHGHHVRVVTWSGGKILGADSGLDRIEVGTPLARRLRWEPLKPLRVFVEYFEYVARIAAEMKRSLSSGCVVQITHPFLLPLVGMCRRRQAKVYYDAFEFYAVMFRQMGVPARILAGLCDILERRYLPQVEGVFCVTSKDGWLRRHLATLNPRVLELWNLPARDQPIDQHARQEARSSFAGKDLVVYVGGLHAEKGLKIFPKVVKQLVKEHTAAHFLVIGNIRADSDPDIWLEKEGISKYCSFLPWSPPAVMNAYLREVAVGLILSVPTGTHVLLGPGGGRKLFTYMAAGLPVVAPRHSSAWDMVEREGIGIQVDSTCEKAVAGAVLELLINNTMRRRMAERARCLFEEKYNWDCQEKKFLNFMGL